MTINVNAPAPQAPASPDPLRLEPQALKEDLTGRYQKVRQFSHQLCQPLEIEDYVVQSMPDVSPTKWHLAHTSWFFETFLLQPGLGGYSSPNPIYNYLFNSYYNSIGQRYARPKRGLLTRPTVREIYSYRQFIDESMGKLLAAASDQELLELAPVLILGLNHEQQHQELILTDLKHVLSCNPLYPVYQSRGASGEEEIGSSDQENSIVALNWLSYPEGLYRIGREGESLSLDFFFDNEGPACPQYLQTYQLASRLITNGEYLEFIKDGGYSNPLLWLSDGWYTVQEQGWQAPLYWENRDGDWWVFTLNGSQKLNLAEPVCHVSYFEADAFAHWAGARLPTEAEWEVAAREVPLEGNFVENERFHPAPAPTGQEGLTQVYGDVWEWTQSAYLPYPGFEVSPGAIGEYNGKFMCNQFVLRGGSCATSLSHIRPTYRNFFPPSARWQFSGIRLAKGPVKQ